MLPKKVSSSLNLTFYIVIELLRVKGFCTGNNERWFYDQDSRSCQNFTYGGCFGNANNFLTREDCEDLCLDDRNDVEDVCDINVDAGPCQGHFPRWGYEKETGSCVKFQYGGCKGNKNRFMSVEECHKTCNYKKQIFEVTWK